MEFAIAADHVFDGTRLRHDCAVVIEASRIRALTNGNELPAAIPSHRLPRGAWVVPGVIDTQVHGGGDVLVNDGPSPRGIAAIAAAHRRFGTTVMLPTLLSDTPEKMRAAREAIEAAAGVDPSVIGLHFEGPFLSPDKAGVHDRGMLRHPEPGDIDLLGPLRNGVTLVTLAPEQVPEGFIARLAAAGAPVAVPRPAGRFSQTPRPCTGR